MKRKLQLLTYLALILFSYQNLKAQETIIEQDWVKTYSSQDSIYNQATAIDVNGNVYVTGFTYNSGTQADITTIKYSDTGTELWVQTFNGTGNKNDRATGINFDSFGNIYVCGFTTNSNNNSDFILIKYNSNGVQQWIETYDNNGNDKANSIVIDNSNNIYVTGFSEDIDNDFLTIKYDQNGNQIWNNRKNFGSNDRAQSIEIYNNNLYISGTAEIADYDFAIISYNLNGTELWSTSVTSAVGNWDFAKDLTVNNNGIFITGYSQNSNVYQYFTVNYSLTGVLNWRKQYRSYGNWNIANSICSDNLGNIYIVGSTRNANTSTITTIKYDQNGNEQWLQNHYMSGNIEKYQPSIICDNDSGIYIAGTVNNGNADFLTIKYDYNGNELWAQTYNGNYNGSDVAADLTIDANDNIYVTGQSYNGSNYDFCTIKYTKRDLFIPEDNQLDPASNNYVFYQNKGQLKNTQNNAIDNYKMYTNNCSPKIFLSEQMLSYVFSKVDKDSISMDTLCRVDMELFRSNKTSLYYYEPIETHLNYFLAHIPEGRTNINGYRRIVVPNIYNNIDLHYYSNKVGFKKYFVVNPGGDIDNVQLKFSGADNVNITYTGDLQIETQIGNKVFEKAYVYRVTPSGNIIPMLSSGNYYVDGNGNIRIQVQAYPSNNTLVVSMAEGYLSTTSTTDIENLRWSTYYGGDGGEDPYSIKELKNGKKGIIGLTTSNNLPLVNGYSIYPYGETDIYFAVFDNQNKANYITYFGGNNYDYGTDMIMLDDGAIVFTGGVQSNDIPTQNSTFFDYNDNTHNGKHDCFIAQIDATSTLKWSTYYGGDWYDVGKSINLDNNGNILITGTADSNFPTLSLTGAYNQNTYGGNGDVFILKFDNTGHRIWSTYFGGSSSENIGKSTVDNNGNLYLTGTINGTGLPVYNPSGSSYNQTYSGSYGGDAFIGAFNTNGAQQWTTYIGGSSAEGLSDYHPIICDDNGNIYLVGLTESSDFPILDNQNYNYNTTTNQGGYDGFIMQFNSSYEQVWGTYFGGTDDDFINAINFDEFGNIYLTGKTLSSDIDLVNLTGAFYQNTLKQNTDAFISVFSTDKTLAWSTYLGGEGEYGDEAGIDLVYINNNLFTTGYGGLTNSIITTDFPFVDYGNGAYYQDISGGGPNDAYISMFDMSPLNSISEIYKNNGNLHIYPNPVSETLHISLKTDDYSHITSTEIIDITGKIIYKQSYKKTKDNILIKVNNLSEGTYFIKIQTEDNIYTEKFIKLN